MKLARERKHGTYTMYATVGCRCDDCREYQRSRVARNRADRLATGRLTHGNKSSYDAGCRCLRCTAANSGKTLHNHTENDIKPYGQCERCDEVHLDMSLSSG